VAFAVFAVTEDSISIEEKTASIRQVLLLNNSIEEKTASIRQVLLLNNSMSTFYVYLKI
jgi:hypothetical protein